MQRRRIESSRNKETTLKNVGRDSDKETHTQNKKTLEFSQKNKRKNETAIDSSRHRQLGEPAALRQTNLLKEEQKKVETRRNKKTKQERTREIMNYYVVGKLKYIIEEIVLLRFRGQNKTDAKKEDQIKEETTVTQYTNTDTYTEIEEAVSKLNVTTLNRSKDKN